jgi:hypothetical protein
MNFFYNENEIMLVYLVLYYVSLFGFEYAVRIYLI